MFPSIEIFGREIGTYGILVVIGGFFCALVGRLLVKRFGMDLFDFLILMLSIGVGIFIGAHIVFALTNIKTLILTFQHIGELWFERFWDLFVSAIGGMVFYGGFLGGLAAIPVYRKFDKRCTCGQLFDVYAVLVPLFLGKIASEVRIFKFFNLKTIVCVQINLNYARIILKIFVSLQREIKMASRFNNNKDNIHNFKIV